MMTSQAGFCQGPPRSCSSLWHTMPMIRVHSTVASLSSDLRKKNLKKKNKRPPNRLASPDGPNCLYLEQMKITPQSDDAANFVMQVMQTANGILHRHTPETLLLVKIDNWFG